MKEEISTIIQQNITLIPLKEIGDNTADQILDLIKERLLGEIEEVEVSEGEKPAGYSELYIKGYDDGTRDAKTIIQNTIK